MSYPTTDEAEAPRLTRAVQWLIAINVAIFFLQLTVVGSTNMQVALGFDAQHLATSWWTVVTYMFVHGGFWHLALNMYTLFLFGPRVEHAWSPGEFIRYYVLCGLGGWFFHLLFSRDALLIGASAAVLGVMLAYAMRWPNDEVYLFGVVPLKVKWLVAMLATINLISGIAGGDQGGGVAYLAHIGGLATGWIYLRSSSSAGIDRLRQRISQVPDVPDETPRAIPRSLPRTREKGNEIDEIISRSNAATTRRPVGAQLSGVRSPRRDTSELDLVLDKISQEGLESLTSDERRILEEMSKELRQ
ncbi:MAG: rhomboid family intramembrane serine protease, partial [Gemmatimonadaceae bacterium]